MLIGGAGARFGSIRRDVDLQNWALFLVAVNTQGKVSLSLFV